MGFGLLRVFEFVRVDDKFGFAGPVDLAGFPLNQGYKGAEPGSKYSFFGFEGAFPPKLFFLLILGSVSFYGPPRPPPQKEERKNN